MMKSARPDRDSLWWQLLLILVVSAVYEFHQLHRGLNPFDEGWPAYAAMRLQAGGVLYRDVFFPFPPGHLIPAWIGYALDPPGIITTRVIYKAFNTLACLGIYLVGRRLMPPRYALFGALMLAIGAPRSHFYHLLFGYRFMVFSMLTLIFFDQRLRTGHVRWMLAAGAAAGVALCFRITPAFAVSCAVGAAVMLASRDWRIWLRDWGAYALGLVLAFGPLLIWIAAGVGLEAFWNQVVTHILVLQSAQSRPFPDFVLPGSWYERKEIYKWFVAFQYRFYFGLYSVYAAVLLAVWARGRTQGRSFSHSFLFAVVVWGGVSILRTLGRSDEPHLDSALPPACLLMAHLAYLGVRSLRLKRLGRMFSTRMTEAGFGLTALAAWTFLLGTDYAHAPEHRANFRLRSVPETVYVMSEKLVRSYDNVIEPIRRWTEPGDLILDLSASPYFYVLADRLGPGYRDIVMPGTFLNDGEEADFVDRLRRSPPAAVIWRRGAFDKMPSRNLGHTAPRVRRWITENYRAAISGFRFAVLLPVGSPHLPKEPDKVSPDAEGDGA